MCFNIGESLVSNTRYNYGMHNKSCCVTNVIQCILDNDVLQ